MIYHLLNLFAFQVEAEKCCQEHAFLQIKIWKHKEMLIYSLFFLRIIAYFINLKHKPHQPCKKTMTFNEESKYWSTQSRAFCDMSFCILCSKTGNLSLSFWCSLVFFFFTYEVVIFIVTLEICLPTANTLLSAKPG